MDKVLLIVRNKETTIKPYKRFFYIKTFYENRIISYKHIKAMYIHKDIMIDFKILLKLGSYFEIHKINSNGDIIIK